MLRVSTDDSPTIGGSALKRETARRSDDTVAFSLWAA